MARLDPAKLFEKFNFQAATQIEQLKLNITEFPSKPLLGLLTPESTAEVQELVTIAYTHRICLYPYSSGMNWGQGSKIPTAEDCLLVDLSRLNRIVEINEEHRFVVIEAGVTQAQLARALENTAFRLPVTGSAANSSITGNILERGATFFGHRNKLLMGLEVVLGNTQTVRTGLWHFFKEEEHPIFYHPEGLGANMTGLFTQSSFGIVTKIVLRLLPKRHGFLLHAEAKENQLVSLVDTFYQLWEEQITQDGVLITNKNDPRTATKGNYTYSGDWFAVSSISGASPSIVAALKAEAEMRLKPYCYHIELIPTDSPETKTHPYFSILSQLYEGKPTNYSLETMAAMQNLELKHENQLDTDKNMIGFSVALPAVPFDGKSVWEVVETVKKVSKELGVQSFHNFGSIGDKVFEGFYRIYFDRKDNSATLIAHKWNQEVHQALEKIGIYPYRSNILQMPYFTNRVDDTFWQTISHLKKTLDPRNIIASRYAPDSNQQ